VAFLWIACACYGQGGTNLLILSYERKLGLTNEWFVSTNQALSSPRWDPLNAAIPLSPDKAVRIAHRWIETNGDTPGSGMTIRIRPLAMFPPYASTYVYIITFDVGFDDQMSCVILMDGSVVEPVRLPLKVPRRPERRRSAKRVRRVSSPCRDVRVKDAPTCTATGIW
jgi:hypothetical protein